MTCIHIYIYTFTAYVFGIYIYIYIYRYIYRYIYMYIYIHIHIHIHIYISLLHTYLAYTYTYTYIYTAFGQNRSNLNCLGHPAWSWSSCRQFLGREKAWPDVDTYPYLLDSYNNSHTCVSMYKQYEYVRIYT